MYLDHLAAAALSRRWISVVACSAPALGFLRSPEIPRRWGRPRPSDTPSDTRRRRSGEGVDKRRGNPFVGNRRPRLVGAFLRKQPRRRVWITGVAFRA